MTEIELRKTMGKYIAQLRVEKGVTLHELSEQIGENIYFLRAVEHGTIDPSIGDVLTILKALETTPKIFFAKFD